MSQAVFMAEELRECKMNNGREFNVFIQQHAFSSRTGILFTCQENGKTLYAKPIELVFEPIKLGDLIVPTIDLDFFTSKELLKALANGLQKVEVYPDKESQVKGELNATKYHLEDMRALLKLQEKTKQ